MSKLVLPLSAKGEGVQAIQTYLKTNTFTKMATMTIAPHQQGTMKAKLSDILVAISWADLSKTYFGKSNSWLYHKLNGIDGNKKPTSFSEAEIETLRGALVDLSCRIRSAADSI